MSKLEDMLSKFLAWTTGDGRLSAPDWGATNGVPWIAMPCSDVRELISLVRASLPTVVAEGELPPLDAIAEVRKQLPNAPDDAWVEKHCPIEISFAQRMIAAELALATANARAETAKADTRKECLEIAQSTADIEVAEGAYRRGWNNSAMTIKHAILALDKETGR